MSSHKNKSPLLKAKSLLKTHVRRPALLAAAAIAVLVAGIGYATTAGSHAHPASAAQLQFCAQLGSGYCLNDWNGGGLGNPVKMYKGGVSHESFALINAGDCGKSLVTSTCPFTHHDLDSEYLGKKIVEVYYTPNGLCLGSGSLYPSGSLQNCSGPNRGIGTVMIQVGNAYINRYWSDLHDNPVMMCSGGSSGGPVYLNSILSSSGSCYWGL